MSACSITGYCHEHGFWHGAEAEELRERFEKLAAELDAQDLDGGLDADDVAGRIRHVLEDVDARDSVAYAEMRVEADADDSEPPDSEHPGAAGARTT